MKQRFFAHNAFWVAYWLVYSYINSRYDNNWSKYLITEGLEMPARMLATYACFAVLAYSEQKPRFLTLIGLVLCNVGGGMINRLLKLWYIVPAFFPDSTIYFWDIGRMMSDIVDCALASGIAISARLYFRQQELLRREAALRSEKLAAELQALKNQLQPHFLFNTINNLYALARVKSDKTAPVALKLAHLLRFVIYEAGKPAVGLESEIRILKDYIALEQLRFDPDRLQVTAHFDIQNPQIQLPPLLLLPLVENAFKHGAGENRFDARVDIRLTEANGRLSLLVSNTKGESPHAQTGGIGLQNLRRQLDLLYPGRHTLHIEDENDRYTVQMDIQI